MKRLFTLLYIFICIWFFDLLGASIVGDGFKVFSAGGGSEGLTLKYLWHILTHPTNGPQYRPISFFLYFYVLKPFFGFQTVFYQLVALAMFAGSTVYLWRILEKLSISILAKVPAVLFAVLHLNHVGFIADISQSEKYFFPLFVVSFGVHWAITTKRVCLSRVLVLFLLCSVAILSHEGAVVFPFIFLSVRYWRIGKIEREMWFTAIPSLLYFLMRLVTGLPSQGFMAVDLGHVIFSMPFYMESVLFGGLGGVFEEKIYVLGVVFLIAWILLGFYYRGAWLLLAVNLALLLPFAVLKNHTYSNRACWASFAFAIVVGLFLKFLLNILRSRANKTALCVAVILALLVGSRHRVVDITNWHATRGAAQEKLLTSSRQQLDMAVDGQKIDVRTDKFSWWINNRVFPGFLALNFPDRRMALTSSSLYAHEEVFVAKGSYYHRLVGGGRWKDPFGYPYKFATQNGAVTTSAITDSTVEIFADIDLVNKLY